MSSSKLSSSDSTNNQEDEEVFEITDFTNASDWEKFVAQIEECITEWQLNHYIKFLPLTHNELADGEWEILNSKIMFSTVSFRLSLHRLKQKENTEQYLEEKEDEDDFHLPQYADDIMNIANDFPPRAHCLARWFGLRCFLELHPYPFSTINHSQANLLRSSANIALHNTCCDVPLFMQVKESWHRIYTGCAISQGVSTNFEIASLTRVPLPYSHLSGLLHIFKTKLGVPALSSDKLQISARFTYVLNDWDDNRRWPVKPINGEEVGKRFDSLPHGCIEDPISELQLAAVWPSTTGDVVSDNDVQQGFNALNAPEWSLRLCYTDDLELMLSYSLAELLKVLSCSDTLSDLMHLNSPPTERDIGQALDRITDPAKSVLSPIVSPKLVEGISKAMSNSQNFIKRGAVSIGRLTVAGDRIPRHIMQQIKTFLFSSGDQPSNDHKSSSNLLNYAQVKAAPTDTFTYNLATCAAVLNLCHGGTWAVAQLWHMVLTELRSYLDNGKCIPSLNDTGPDHRSCLLHQKLQMLNFCISRKQARESRGYAENTESKAVPKEESESLKTQTAIEESVESEQTESNPVLDSGESVTNEPSESLQDEDKDSNIEHSNNTAEETIESPKDLGDSKSVNSSDDSDDDFFDCEDEVDDSAEAGESEKVETAEAGESEKVETAEEEKEEILVASQDAEIEKETSREQNQIENIRSTEDGTEVECATETLPQPEGRLEQLDNLTLLHHTCTPLYIPVTQDHALLTEDQLEEQAEIFSSLGDSQEGSKVRAKMQSVSLEADMSAFKAANPGCCLEDFVRWYSPRDFEDGALSVRMCIPDNLWVTTWCAAPAIPAHRQKRLFDDTKEAEKVLHFLANLKPAQIVQLLLPICVYDALLRLRHNVGNLSQVVPSLKLMCGQAEQIAAFLFRDWNVSNPSSAASLEPNSPINELIELIEVTEKMVERSRSLLHKFSAIDDQTEMQTFVRRLLEHPEVTVDGSANGRVGKIVRRFFLTQQERAHQAQQQQHDNSNKGGASSPPTASIQPLPDPVAREFIIRCQIHHPTEFSQKLPQRLYALLRRTEFRLATAISTDSTFF